jgi:hypothetical protein
MTQADRIETRLIELGLDISFTRRLNFGRQIQVGCGPVINVYDNGTVLVQGRLCAYGETKELDLLKQALPRNTRWSMTVR